MRHAPSKSVIYPEIYIHYDIVMKNIKKNIFFFNNLDRRNVRFIFPLENHHKDHPHSLVVHVPGHLVADKYQGRPSSSVCHNTLESFFPGGSLKFCYRFYMYMSLQSYYPHVCIVLCYKNIISPLSSFLLKTLEQ
jgi:hypothetical protein